MSDIDEPQASQTLQTMLVLYIFARSSLADHLAIEINQGTYYVECFESQFAQYASAQNEVNTCKLAAITGPIFYIKLIKYNYLVQN